MRPTPSPLSTRASATSTEVWRGLWLALAVLLFSGPSAAAPRVVLKAVLRPDLQTVVGTLSVEPDAELRFVDGLQRVPVPEDDQLRRYTFPGPVESGWLHLEQRTDTEWSFHAMLPRRYGASGTVPGRGVFLNGLWHPQPMQGESLALVEWDAEVSLPAGLTGVLNGAVSEHRVAWTGESEWLAFAALEDARIQQLELPVGSVTLVDQGPPRPRRDAYLATLIEEGWPGPQPPSFTLVETPSRRRLTRAGPGMLFVSDRALRVSGGLKVFHEDALLHGLMLAGTPLPRSFSRSLVAAALADAAPAPDLREALGWFAWIPQIDSLLYSGRLPFYSEVFGEAWPGDPVEDDIRQVLDPVTPGRAITRRLDLRHGSGAAERLAWALVGGSGLAEACSAQGIPFPDLLAWKRRPPAQALSLTVEVPSEGGATVVVTRAAGPRAPAEPIAIDVDEVTTVWEAGAADTEHRLSLVRAPHVAAVDPDGLVRQADRADDRWPIRWTPVAYLWWDDLAFAGGGLSAGGTLLLRKQYATRNLFGGTVAVSPQDSLRGSLRWTHLFGPLQDRRQRPYRWTVGAGPALLRPVYRPTDAGRVAAEVWTSLSKNTLVDPFFPRRGHRVGLGVNAGQILNSASRWLSVSSSAQGVVSAWGRLAVAGRVRGGVATGDVEHRLLPLGGSDGVQGLAAATAVGRGLLVGNAEVRLQPIRFASLPGPLLWVSDLQLGAGVDAGVLADAVGGAGELAERATAVGWTASLGGTGDLLGAYPMLLGLWVAGPIGVQPETLGTAPLQLYLRMRQAF